MKRLTTINTEIGLTTKIDGKEVNYRHTDRQNAAARLVSSGRQYDHITLMLHQLHWASGLETGELQDSHLGFSVRCPAWFQHYLAADCQLSPEEGRRQLRSADSRTCVVRQTYSNCGERCFMAAGPRLWNSLPAGLRETDIGYEQFKWLLKSYFVWTFRSRLIVTIVLADKFIKVK